MHATFQRGWVGSIEPTISIGHWIGETQRDLAVYVKFPILPSLDITQVKKSPKITFSSISPYSHKILFSPSSLFCTSPLYEEAWSENNFD